MPQFSQASVQEMLAREKRQNRGRSSSQARAQFSYASIGSAVLQASVEYLNCVLTPPGGHVDLRQIQIELRLVASQTYGCFAQGRRSRPFPLGSGNGEPQKGEVVGF